MSSDQMHYGPVFKPTAEHLHVYEIGWNRFVYVDAGRAEELHLHLLSHGIESVVESVHNSGLARLELESDVDTETVQAILDHWEK